MMQSNNEDVKSCAEAKSSATLNKVLIKIIESEQFIHYEIDKQHVSAKYNSVLGLLHEINIKGTTKSGDKVINIFAKSFEVEDDISTFPPILDIYTTEFIVYKELLKAYEEIQEEANVPRQMRYKSVKFYEESIPEAILMENIAIKGFETFGAIDLVTLPLAKIFVQELARFHCLSFVLKERRPEYFKKIIESLKCSISFKTEWRLFIQSAKKSTLPFIDEQFKKSVEREYDLLADKYLIYFINDGTTTACICHGDFKVNNIMVRMEDGEVQETICLDYQHAKYACPIYDFLYFIYFNTDREFRKAHMSDLKNLYYDTLSTFMKKFDIDPESVYPRIEFERTYQEKLEFGLSVSLVFMLLAFVPKDGITDWVNLRFKVDERFKERMHGVIKDYVEWGYL